MPRLPFVLLDARYPRLGCGLALALLTTTACAPAAARMGAPSPESRVAGTFHGRFVFGTDGFRSTLQLRSAGPGRVAGAFRVSDPIEIQGVVTGVVVDDLLRIRVTWNGPDGCDGMIEGILDVRDGGSEIDGPVTVADCGEPVAGRMSFTRQVRNPRRPAGEVTSFGPPVVESPPCP